MRFSSQFSKLIGILLGINLKLNDFDILRDLVIVND